MGSSFGGTSTNFELLTRLLQGDRSDRASHFASPPLPSVLYHSQQHPDLYPTILSPGYAPQNAPRDAHQILQVLWQTAAAPPPPQPLETLMRAQSEPFQGSDRVATERRAWHSDRGEPHRVAVAAGHGGMNPGAMNPLPHSVPHPPPLRPSPLTGPYLTQGKKGPSAAAASAAAETAHAVAASSGPMRPLPCTLENPLDTAVMSEHQVVLRQQIEAFGASQLEVNSYIRRRNRPLFLGQVGLRCRHCTNIPMNQRGPGATYFPSSINGLYQAAQNMSSLHVQCGACPEMPSALKQQFVDLIPTKNLTSKVGRAYWAQCAKAMGLVDTERGIFFVGPSAGDTKPASVPTDASQTRYA